MCAAGNCSKEGKPQSIRCDQGVYTIGWVRRNRSRVGGRTAYNSIQVGKVGQNTGNAKGGGLGPWEVEKEVACGYGGRAWERAGKGGVGAGEV